MWDFFEFLRNSSSANRPSGLSVAVDPDSDVDSPPEMTRAHRLCSKREDHFATGEALEIQVRFLEQDGRLPGDEVAKTSSDMYIGVWIVLWEAYW